MQRTQSILTLLAALTLAGTSAQAEPVDWEIDPEHFSIAFEIDHMGFQRQIGLFRDASGRFRFDPETEELVDGRVEVGAASVFTDHDERDGHVRGEDFLDAEDHPDIVFEATAFEPAENGSGTLSGELTMLGKTHPVELQARINKRASYPFGHGKETLGISARTTIKRSRWGMDYAVSNNLVGDEVALRFEFEAIRH
jgi:polyisoprenoid-binding protein YceI